MGSSASFLKILIFMAKNYRSKSKTGYGFKLYYPPEFNEEFKRYVRQRDGYLCSICHARVRLDVHHIDYNRFHTVTANCISLCRTCHELVHRSSSKRKLAYKKQLGMLARQREKDHASSR